MVYIEFFILFLAFFKIKSIVRQAFSDPFTLRYYYGCVKINILLLQIQSLIVAVTKFYLGHPVSQNCPYFRGWVFRTNSPSVLVLKVEVDDKYVV